MVTNDLGDWLRLEQTPGVGPGTARKLLAQFGLPANIFSSSYAQLIGCVSERIAGALLEPVSDATRALTERSQLWAQQTGNHILTLADPDYPARLLEISDPPLIVYLKGRRELLERPALAIVGSRNATAQGLANAESFAESLAAQGLTIISGLALGIDAAAHTGGLRRSSADGGSTIAVIGTGADIVYPARNRGLAHQIAESGCIVSEYPLGMPAIEHNFPKRNRIISGLASGVLVVEAAARSGSLITARMAAEQGREVFAIPGSIHSPLAKGCHQLIKQGAKLVESAQDILEELGNWQGSNIQAAATEPTPAKADSALLAALGYDPVDIDQLAARSGLPIDQLQGELFDLELQGILQRLPGGLVQRKA